MDIAALESFLHKIDDIDFFLVKDDMLVEKLTASNRNKEVLFSMSLAELAVLDNRLPMAIEGLLQETASVFRVDMTDTVLAYLLCETITHWLSAQVLLTIEGKQWGYRVIDNLHVTDVEGVPTLKASVSVIHIRPYNARDGRLIDIAFHYVADRRTAMTLCPVWLNETYPGWRERFLVAKELDYSGVTLCELVLTKPPVAAEVHLTAGACPTFG